MRPALVVQADRNNSRLRNTIIAMITSTTRRAAEPTQLLIDVNTPEGRHTGLLHSSAVTCENLFTIEQQLVARVIGTLPPMLLAKVDGCLKESLGV